MNAYALKELVVVENTLVKRRIRRAVAELAGRGEAGRRMVRILSRQVIRLVAAITVSRRALVHIILVAGGAGLGGVDPDALEELIVVERALGEGGVGCAVAELTRRGESGRRMVRILSR